MTMTSAEVTPAAMRRLYEAGIELRSPRADVDVEQAAQMYRSGRTLREVGAAFGVTGETIRSRFKEAGVDVRLAGRVPRTGGTGS